MIAHYHLEAQPTTFDFAVWLSTVKTWGAEKVSFIGKKFKPKQNYPYHVAWTRFENLVKPLCELADIPVVKEADKEPVYFTHFMKGAHMAWRENSKIWKYPYEKKHDHITVTLRDSFRNKYRDANRPEWDKFISWAENRGEKVVLIEDAEQNGISIRDRWDAYQCKLNFFTGGGPAALCWMSDAPYVSFFKSLVEHDYYLLSVHHWMYTNSQLPWAKQNQKIIWNTQDKFENIVKQYERFATSGAH